MTVRERLHQLIDSVPEPDLPRTERVLLALVEPQFSLEDCPEDDEPETEEERLAVQEAWEEHRRGEGLTTAELRRKLAVL